MNWRFKAWVHGLLITGAACAAMLAFLYRTDPWRIAEKVAGPYGSFRINEGPGDLRMVKVNVDQGREVQWVLEYSLTVLQKRVECDAVLVHQRVDRAGDERPAADRAFEAKPQSGVTYRPIPGPTRQVPVPKLLPGNYTLLVEYTCLQIDPHTRVRSQVLQTARDMACFIVAFGDFFLDDTHPLTSSQCRSDVFQQQTRDPNPRH